MRRRDTTTRRLRYLCLSAAVGCGAVVDPPQVDYGDAKPLGAWSPATAQTTFETEALDVEPQTGSPAGAPGVATNTTVAQPKGSSAPTTEGPKNVAGAPPPGVAGAAAGSAAHSDSPEAAGAAAPSDDREGELLAPEAPEAVTELEVSFTTESLGGRYAPKNVGAVWVTDSGGKLVKSLEVWARIRLRYLTGYAAARGSARADVTATATMTNHKPHTASWDLKDAGGDAVPPGEYTLHAELTDTHMAGKTVTIPFDTSAGATTIEPPDSPGFVGIKLVIQ